MPWTIIQMLEKSLQNSSTSPKCSSIKITSTLGEERIDKKLMTFSCLIGVITTPTNLWRELERPLRATMWAKAFQNGSTISLDTNSSVQMLSDPWIRTRQWPMKTESTSKRSLRPSLIWQNHINCKCIITVRPHPIYWASNKKSILPKSIRRKYTNKI